MVAEPIENAAIDLAHAAAELAEARRTNERLGGELGDLRAAFNERHAPLIAQLQESATKLHAAEDAYRRAALTEYKATGKKRLGYGASIRTTKVVRYEPDNVVAWAKANAPTLLRVDTKAFEAMVKASPAAFEAVALVDEQAAATIPTDTALLECCGRDGEPCSECPMTVQA